MEEYRCHKCHTLLYKATENIDGEIICHKCRTINYPLREDQCSGLRGKDFQMKCLDHRCDNCSRLLVKTNGDGVLEIKCKYCKHISKHDTLAMREGSFKFRVTPKREEIRKRLAQ